ncbi:MAG: NAD(P)/FAD-dependent oxidoreductase [Bacteroidales bacterium]
MKTKTAAEKKKIVLLGAGFAGLKFAKLMKQSDYDITIIDRHNYHEFAPLFYQIASCGLEPGAICFPLRKEFRNASHIHFRLGEVKSIDPLLHKVTTDTDDFFYDYLIIATGTTTKFFGMQEVKDYSFTLKTTSESLLIRNQVLLCLEKAVECNNPVSRKQMLTFVISGAGPAGVEIGGALGEMKKYVLPREYPELHPEEMRILLIEAADKVLRTMSENASQKSARFLHELEVEVMLNTSIVNYDGHEVVTSTGEHVPTDTVIWTAGVEGSYFPGLKSDDYGASNRLLVDRFNRLIHYESIYSIGDCCLMITPEKPHGDPQVAQVAIQQAVNLANNLISGEFSTPFNYKDKGSMATIGRNRAVVDLKHSHLAGRFAWWMWLLVHLVTLVGVRNKIVTLINWVWNYFSYNSSLRLLIKPAIRNKRPKPECSHLNKNDSYSCEVNDD